MVPRPILLFLCFSLAWTFACAYPHARAFDQQTPSYDSHLADEVEREMWRRQVVRRQVAEEEPTRITIVRHNGQETEIIEAPGATTSRRAARTTTAAVEDTSVATATTRRTALVGNPKAFEPTTREFVSTTSVGPAVVTTTTRALATSPPAASTTLAFTPSSSSTTSTSLSSIRAVSLSSSSSSRASSSTTSSSPRASASIATSTRSSSFVDPSNKFFPLAVVIFVVIGLVACLLVILLVRRCCGKRRSTGANEFRHDELFPASSRDDLTGAAASTGSASPDSFDEKWTYPSQYDAGMRMHGGPTSSEHDHYADDEDEEPLAYLARRHSARGPAQLPERALPPGAAPPMRAYSHRRTASVVLPPVPAVTHQPRHDDFSADALPSSQPSFRATPPSALLVAHGAQQANMQQANSVAQSQKPYQPMGLPQQQLQQHSLQRPQPPVPAQSQTLPHQRMAPAFNLPHQPARPSSLRIAMSLNSPEQSHPPHVASRAPIRRDQLVLDEFGIGAGTMGVGRM